MLRMAEESGLSIAAMKRANESVARSEAEVDAGLARIWPAMDGCIERGLSRDGELPGGLKVRRRAKRIRDQLMRERGSNTVQPHVVSDWLNVYAMAVNEENAAGGKVVTAPTNGAAGVVPAVIRYYLDHCIGAEPAQVPDFLLTAAAIGGLIKHNASISGAEAGCQGEVGSASAMAAAGLCAVLGGTPAQVENAAEIALEHHLGMTCDPVGRPGPGALHRAQRHRRHQGGRGRLAGAARRRLAFHAARQLHRGDAADGRGDERQVQGNEPRRPRRQPAGMLNAAAANCIVYALHIVCTFLLAWQRHRCFGSGTGASETPRMEAGAKEVT